MKKNTLKSLVAYLNGEDVTDLPEIKAELEAELVRGEAKAQANRDLYAAAYDVVMAHLNATPVTAVKLYEACKDELPEGFSKSKVQYALLNYWDDEVVKHDNGKKPFTYSRA